MFNFLIGMGILKAIFGESVNTEVFQRRLGLICFVIISLVIAGTGYFRSHWLADEIAELNADGATGFGKIVDKTSVFRNNNLNYDFVIEYVDPDLTRHRKGQSTYKSEYESKPIGSSVPILYIKSKPDTFYMVGHEPKSAEISLMRYFLYGGLGCLGVTLTLLATMWGGGGPSRASKPPTSPPSPTAPAAPVGPGIGPRATFGRRGG
jgi:hypothetical protein